jgi:hypothetical protein
LENRFIERYETEGASEGEIEGGAKFWKREPCVEEEERMREGGRKTYKGLWKEGRRLC